MLPIQRLLKTQRCNIINILNEIYVEKDTGLLIKADVDYSNTEYKYEFNNTDDAIFIEPDINQYQLEEKNNISTTTNTSTSNIVMPNTNISIDNNIVFENDIPEEQDYSIDANKITIEVEKNTITPTCISIIIVALLGL